MTSRTLVNVRRHNCVTRPARGKISLVCKPRFSCAHLCYRKRIELTCSRVLSPGLLFLGEVLRFDERYTEQQNLHMHIQFCEMSADFKKVTARPKSVYRCAIAVLLTSVYWSLLSCWSHNSSSRLVLSSLAVLRDWTALLSRVTSPWIVLEIGQSWISDSRCLLSMSPSSLSSEPDQWQKSVSHKTNSHTQV